MRSELYNIDCLEYMKTLPDESVDVICTDPPYKYLDHKLDRDFDEQVFFDEAVRLLKDGGWIILFGRGTSFYRWNTMLHERGMVFKEEVIWDKIRPSSFLNPLKRKHETISIFCKKCGHIFKSSVPYLEKKEYDLYGIIADIKRMRAILNNTKELDAVLDYLETNSLSYNECNKSPVNYTTNHSVVNRSSRPAECLKQMREGMSESSIISVLPEQYKRIHPTEKPVRLIERLLQLVIKEGVVLDPFSGSGSCRIACHNLGLDFIGCEIDEEYYNASQERYQKECEGRLL